MPASKRSTNMYNNAHIIHDMYYESYTKSKPTKILWFSLMLGFFLMSYRRTCIVIRKLKALKYRYRLFLKLKRNQVRTSKITSARQRYITQIQNESTSIADGAQVTDIFKNVSNWFTSYRFLLTKNSTRLQTGWFLRINSTQTEKAYLSMYSRSYDRIFYFKSRIRKSVLPLGTYVKSIRIIDKYRAKLLQNLIIRRHSFLETNNYLRYIPVSKHSFVKFLVQYLFDFRYRKKSQRKLQFEHIMHLRRHVGLYYKDTSKWHRIRKFFFQHRNSSKQFHTKYFNRPRVFRFTFAKLFTICSFIFGSDIQRSQNFSYKRTNPQQSGGIQSAVLTLMNAVYGTTKLGVHPYVAKVYKSIRLNHNMQSNAVSIFFFLERHVNYFLSIFLNVPIQDINIMLKKKLITVNGAFVSERYLIRNFDFITFNCTKPAVSDSLNIFNQLYNNSAFWYLWTFFLKSWTYGVRHLKDDLLKKLYIELVKRSYTTFLKPNSLPDTYLYFFNWPFKSVCILRNQFLFKLLDSFIFIQKINSIVISDTLFFDWMFDVSVIAFDTSICDVSEGTCLDIRTFIKISNTCILKFFKQVQLSLLKPKIQTPHLNLYTHKYFLLYGSLRTSFFNKKKKSAMYLKSIKMYQTQHNFKLFRTDLHNSFLIVLPRFITSFFMRRFRINTRNYQVWATYPSTTQLSTNLFFFNFTPSSYSTNLSLIFKNVGTSFSMNTFLPSWYV